MAKGAKRKGKKERKKGTGKSAAKADEEGTKEDFGAPIEEAKKKEGKSTQPKGNEVAENGKGTEEASSNEENEKEDNSLEEGEIAFDNKAAQGEIQDGSVLSYKSEEEDEESVEDDDELEDQGDDEAKDKDGDSEWTSEEEMEGDEDWEQEEEILVIGSMTEGSRKGVEAIGWWLEDSPQWKELANLVGR
jgi:hypothetical protein